MTKAAARRRDVELGEPRTVVRVYELEMRNVMTIVRHAVRLAHGLEAVERSPDRGVANCVHMHLEAHCVEAREELVDLLLRIEELA